MLLAKLEIVLGRASKLAAWLGGVVLLIMLLLFCANIALRMTGGGLHGTVEISGYLCAMAVGLCLPAAQLGGSHIELGVLTAGFSERSLSIQKALVSVLSMLVLLFVFKELLDLANYTSLSGETIEGFPFSGVAMILGMSFGVLLHALLFLSCVLRVFMKPEKVQQ